MPPRIPLYVLALLAALVALAALTTITSIARSDEPCPGDPPPYVLDGEPAVYCWPPATGPVDHYNVDFRLDGGTWLPAFPSEIHWGVLVPAQLVLGATLELRVQAVDVAGNDGPWSNLSNPAPVIKSADLNGDGVVGGVPDFAVFRDCYGARPSPGGYCDPADLNGDGVVGIPDFSYLIAQINRS